MIDYSFLLEVGETDELDVCMEIFATVHVKRAPQNKHTLLPVYSKSSLTPTHCPVCSVWDSDVCVSLRFKSHGISVQSCSFLKLVSLGFFLSCEIAAFVLYATVVLDAVPQRCFCLKLFPEGGMQI